MAVAKRQFHRLSRKKKYPTENRVERKKEAWDAGEQLKREKHLDNNRRAAVLSRERVALGVGPTS